MKKILFLLAMLPMMCYGQDSSDKIKEYCAVKLENKNGYILKDGYKYFLAMKDSTEQRVKFNTDIELLNYMSRGGWELHPISINYSGSSGKYYEYIFWRYIKREENNKAEH